MLRGIRSRLLFSYILLLFVTLAIMAGALVVFLSARPAVSQERVLREILEFATEHNNPRAFLGPLLRRPPTLDDLPFLSAAEREDVRVLLADTSNDTLSITTDSYNRYAPGDQPDIREWEPVRLRDGPIDPPGFATRGVFEENGEEWVFLALQSVRPRERSNAQYVIMLAKMRSTVPLIVAVQDLFGANLGTAILQAGGIGGAVAVVMAVIITRTIATPLRNMATAAGAVAEGDYSQRVPEQGPTEVMEVAQAFNRMSEQVELNNQAQRDLLANVSHDLKTPLTSIQGYSQAIMDGATNDPAKSASVIYDEAGRLTRLVEQLTELARLKAGRLSMRQDLLDMGEMVQALAQKIVVVAQKKNIRLDTDIQPVPRISGDGDRLAQVVTNLLSNAVKYTPSGGRVRASVCENGSGIHITVRDTGIGIPQEDISRVFERFYQVDKARGPQRGHGLGLAITQEIVQAHGGHIRVQSAGRGKGSTFTVWLPMDSRHQTRSNPAATGPH